MKTQGISFCLTPQGLYLGPLLEATIRPRFNDGEEVSYTGFRLDLVWGRLIRPIPKFWEKDFWARDDKINDKYNPWNSGNHWFVLDIPFVIMPFLCVLFKKAGFYIGGRTARMQQARKGHIAIDWQLRTAYTDDLLDSDTWAWDKEGMPVQAWGDASIYGQLNIEPTMSIRADFSH